MSFRDILAFNRAMFHGKYFPGKFFLQAPVHAPTGPLYVEADAILWGLREPFHRCSLFVIIESDCQVLVAK